MVREGFLRWLFRGLKLNRQFNQETRSKIENLITSSEMNHSSEIKLYIESALPLVSRIRFISSRQRAIELFKNLEIWDTRDNNGILVYLNLSEHRLEIIADRSLHGKIPNSNEDNLTYESKFKDICDSATKKFFPEEKFAEGIEYLVLQLNQLLTSGFPKKEDDTNEISNTVIVR
jgi:uncharacterized membrane protein